MTNRRSPDYMPLLFLVISLLALGLVPLLTFSGSIEPLGLPWRKQVVGAIFIVICLLGAIAGVSPSRCKSLLLLGREHSNSATNTNHSSFTESAVTMMGHHPNCGYFSTHVLQWDNKILCAGCTGLTIGAVIAIIGSVWYFFLGFPVGHSVVLFWLGFLGAALGLLQHSLYRLFKVTRGIVRTAVNILFVVGTLLLLISIDLLTMNFVIDLYLLFVIIYWIFTRIRMSKFGHQRICTACDIEMCSTRQR